MLEEGDRVRITFGCLSREKVNERIDDWNNDYEGSFEIYRDVMNELGTLVAINGDRYKVNLDNENDGRLWVFKKGEIEKVPDLVIAVKETQHD